MENLYESAAVVEAGTALELIQMESEPGKDHRWLYECNTCLIKEWVVFST